MAVQIHQILANNLKRLRALRGYTQEQCSDVCDVSLRYYQHLEACDRWPSPEIIKKLAKGLRCKQVDLFKEP